MNYHILLITPGFPINESETNTVTYLVNFIKQFKARYPTITFTILSFHYPFKAGCYDWHGIEVHAFGGFHLPKIMKPSVWFNAYRLAKKIHTHNPISHIHTLWLKDTTMVGQFIAKKLKLNIISTIMGTEFRGVNKYLSKINLFDINLVTVSPLQNDMLTQFNNKLKSTVIPWGIPATHLAFNEQKRSIDLLFVGYLNEIKNVSLFIEIIEKVLITFPNLKVSIVGDIFGGSKWREISKEKNLDNVITFHGILTNEKTLKIMRVSKILVHTSSFESLGYAMLEAIASGLYVVSKQVGIANASAHWKIAENTTEFIHNIESLLSNYTEPESRNLFPIKDTVEAYKNCYDTATII